MNHAALDAEFAALKTDISELKPTTLDLREDVKIVCPKDMEFDVHAICVMGEYDLDVAFQTPPRILDIGANIGAFAAWASTRWPGARITCYEPNPKALEYLEKNAPEGTTIVRAAVMQRASKAVKLFAGATNLGEASLCEELGQTTNESIDVECVSAASLPRCEILKIDTEGCELEILDGYDLTDTAVVMYEWHREVDRVALNNLLEGEGFELWSCKMLRPWIGVARWVRKRKP